MVCLNSSLCVAKLWAFTELFTARKFFSEKLIPKSDFGVYIHPQKNFLHDLVIFTFNKNNDLEPHPSLKIWHDGAFFHKNI
jgi:hypothetical protein